MPKNLTIQSSADPEGYLIITMENLLEGAGYYDASSPYLFYTDNGTVVELTKQGTLEFTFPDGGTATLRGLGFKGSDEELQALTMDDWQNIGLRIDSAQLMWWGDLEASVFEPNDKNATIRGMAGSDTIFGGAGDDRLDGGRDDDLLVGGRGDDTMRGGAGNDVIVTGLDNDRALGGRGMDLFIDAGDGRASWTGGAGADTFVIGADGVQTTASGNPQGIIGAGIGGIVRITDFSAEDTLMFTSNIAEVASGNPQGVWTDMRPGATLADWNGAGVDNFQFRDTAQGVQIQSGDERVLLQDVATEDVLLSQLFWIDDTFVPLNNGVWKAPANDQIGESPAGLDVYAYDLGDRFALTDGGPYGQIMFETFMGFGNETSV